MSEYCMGEMIKRTRKMQNMSQEELAFGICSVSTLSRIENGLETPARATFEKMIERLGGAKGLPPCDTTGDDAYRLRHLAVRNIIRGQQEKNDFLIDEYAAIERADAFGDYMKASKCPDEQDANESIALLKSVFAQKGIKGDGNGIDYAILEPYEVHAFILYAKCLCEKGEYTKAERTLNSLKKYLEESYNTDGIYGELYIVLLAECADIAIIRGNSAECLAMCALALNEIDCRGKTFLKKKVFDIKAKAYELDGRKELERECRNYAGVLAELIKSCASERKRPVSVAMFNYF